jgi:hypothetical protein
MEFTAITTSGLTNIKLMVILLHFLWWGGVQWPMLTLRFVIRALSSYCAVGNRRNKNCP